MVELFPSKNMNSLNDINYDYFFAYIVTDKDFEDKYEDVEISVVTCWRIPQHFICLETMNMWNVTKS